MKILAQEDLLIVSHALRCIVAPFQHLHALQIYDRCMDKIKRIAVNKSCYCAVQSGLIGDQGTLEPETIQRRSGGTSKDHNAVMLALSAKASSVRA